MLTQIVIVGRSLDLLRDERRLVFVCPSRARGRPSNPAFIRPPLRARLPYNLRMIPRDLLDLVVCPACQTPLVMKEDGGSLKCGSCHRVYPVRGDIPVLLVDEATIEP